MLKRIWAWVTHGRLVWLRDFDGDTTLAIARLNPWGEWVAERWWPWKIRSVILKDDGSVKMGIYVKQWKDAA